MVEKLDGGLQLLLSPEESDLFGRQTEAQQSGDVTKEQADYQNEPHEGEQCSGCSMFVPGFPDDVGGFCTKVQSFRGPLGMIFEDGWCKFFAPVGESTDDDAGEEDDLSDLDDDYSEITS